MRIPIYQIDAFTDAPFGGNPAAICPLDAWLADDVLQAIALENNLSETAFYVAQGDRYHLRWFTPAMEVELCGHATLATAHLILNRLSPALPRVTFETRSGALVVQRVGDKLAMDFPGLATEAPMQAPSDLIAALGTAPRESYPIRKMHNAPYWLFVYETEAQVAALTPNFITMEANVIATAPGQKVDFVSRFFAPMSGINEDPVTGSAHCTLAPYWGERLGKTELAARQISARGGEVGCCLNGDRVILTGKCVFYMAGEIELSV